MKVLDLFSGIGGFSLGLHRAGMETVAFCEIEKYPQAVLRKNFPGVPIYDDVRTITAARLAADGVDTIDLICGGFPCQPFSVAGKQQGKNDHRHLWPEMFRIIQEVRPTWVIGENVAGFVSMALCEVSADLEGAGYEVQSFIIPACAVNAPHRRDRVWVVANTRLQRQEVSQEQAAGIKQCSQADGYTNGAGCEEQHPSDLTARSGQCSGELVATGPDWSAESPFCGVAHGIPRRVDRLKALGNAVVPQIPEILGRSILEIENNVRNHELSRGAMP